MGILEMYYNWIWDLNSKFTVASSVFYPLSHDNIRWWRHIKDKGLKKLPFKTSIYHFIFNLYNKLQGTIGEVIGENFFCANFTLSIFHVYSYMTLFIRFRALHSSYRLLVIMLSLPCLILVILCHQITCCQFFVS